MLQGGLQDLVGIGRGKCRLAIGIGGAAAVQKIVVVERLSEREVARVHPGGVADDACRSFLGDIRGHHPGLDGIFAGGGDEIMQFPAGLRGSLGLAADDVDPPAAHPADIPLRVRCRPGSTPLVSNAVLP